MSTAPRKFTESSCAPRNITRRNGGREGLYPRQRTAGQGGVLPAGFGQVGGHEPDLGQADIGEPALAQPASTERSAGKLAVQEVAPAGLRLVERGLGETQALVVLVLGSRSPTNPMRRALRPTSSIAALQGLLVPIYALGDVEPDIDEAAFVHPDAVVIGQVRIGPEVLRGGRARSCGAITAGSRSGRGPRSRMAPWSIVRGTGRRSSVASAWSGTTPTWKAAWWRTSASSAPAAAILNRAVVKAGVLVAASALIPEGFEVPALTGLGRWGSRPPSSGLAFLRRSGRPQYEHLPGLGPQVPFRAAAPEPPGLL